MSEEQKRGRGRPRIVGYGEMSEYRKKVINRYLDKTDKDGISNREKITELKKARYNSKLTKCDVCDKTFASDNKVLHEETLYHQKRLHGFDKYAACECGSTVLTRNLNLHKQSKKHLNFIHN